MTAVAQMLDEVTLRLASGATPRDDAFARDLVAAVLDVPRGWPSLNRDLPLTPEEVGQVERAAVRVRAGMPLQYAIGRAAFRHLDLAVDERVLIPRPETEQLVDLALALTGGVGTAIDVGTGSGAIALALATEGQFSRVIATDVSVGALAVAHANALAVAGAGAGLARPPEFRLGSWLAPCAGERADLVVSNPPYIAVSEAADLPAEVRDWEPPIALFAADGGMAGVAAVAQESVPILVAGGWLVLEVDARRAGRAAEAVRATGAYGEISVRADLTGRARFIVARREKR